MDILKYIFGYPKIELQISNIQLIFGYPKIGVYFRITIIHFWISINRIMDFKYSTVFGYQKIDLWISKNRGVL